MNFQLQMRRCKVGGSVSVISRTSMSCPATSVASSKFLIVGTVRTGTRTDMATASGIQNGNGPPREPDVIGIGFTDMKDGRNGLDSVVRFMDNNSDKDREGGYKQANGREQDARPLQNPRKTHF